MNKNIKFDLSVLYVEDSKIVRESSYRFFQLFFDKIVVATNGLEGIEKFKQNPTFDIVITDIVMPHLDGISMMKEIKKINPDVLLIVISSYYDYDKLLGCVEAGVNDFLQKPINANKLKEIIEHHASQINNKQSHIGENFFDKMILEEQLKSIKNINAPLLCYNTYKGIPIKHQGFIEKIEENQLTIKVDEMQGYSASIQKNIIFDCDLLGKSIKADVLQTVDFSTLTLGNCISFQKNSYIRSEVRVDVCDDFKLYIFINSKSHLATIKDLSINSISFSFLCADLDLNEASISLSASFPVLKNKLFYGSHNIERINSKSKIIKFETNGLEHNVIATLPLSKIDKEMLGRYMFQRVTELTTELKNNLKKIEQG